MRVPKIRYVRFLSGSVLAFWQPKHEPSAIELPRLDEVELLPKSNPTTEAFLADFRAKSPRVTLGVTPK